jgi:hypothetical protein
MLGLKLMRLIEKNSDELAVGLTEKLQSSERTQGFRRIPPPELHQTTAEVYHNLGEWLLRKTEKDIEERFRTIAARRAAEGINLHELVWALIISRSHLWQFLTTNTFADNIVQLYGEMELQLLLSQFFDNAVYYTILGYLKVDERESTARERSTESEAAGFLAQPPLDSEVERGSTRKARHLDTR